MSDTRNAPEGNTRQADFGIVPATTPWQSPRRAAGRNQRVARAPLAHRAADRPSRPAGSPEAVATSHKLEVDDVPDRSTYRPRYRGTEQFADVAGRKKRRLGLSDRRIAEVRRWHTHADASSFLPRKRGSRAIGRLAGGDRRLGPRAARRPSLGSLRSGAGCRLVAARSGSRARSIRPGDDARRCCGRQRFA